MIVALGLVVFLILVCFSFVLIFGAPYLPTLTPQVQMALDLADLQPGQLLLELGCGDGKILLAAAKRGIRSEGFELNPLLVIICYVRTWRYRKLVRVRFGNFFTKQWPNADAIFIFGLQRLMLKVDKKIMQSSRKPVKLVSFAFTIPDRKPTKEKQGLLLYEYHAN